MNIFNINQLENINFSEHLTEYIRIGSAKDNALETLEVVVRNGISNTLFNKLIMIMEKGIQEKISFCFGSLNKDISTSPENRFGIISKLFFGKIGTVNLLKYFGSFEHISQKSID
ncbi:hypothetical protein RF11_15419 [Thelohanellus kitauei]|uniref:Uncharacterized protein n=1 Tax=Thelohanellus kitauei TaxID=669202 RepID=A0A0C2N462_THEKT|nr:hypothetical protein RF11_15419 [Thelohanellus kitauei]